MSRTRIASLFCALIPVSVTGGGVCIDDVGILGKLMDEQKSDCAAGSGFWDVPSKGPFVVGICEGFESHSGAVCASGLKKENASGAFINCKDGLNDTLYKARTDSYCNSKVKCGEVHLLEFEAGNMILEYKPDALICEGGMFLPFIPGEFLWDQGWHAIIYALMLVFEFLGVAIIADVFMAAIEVITSKTKSLTTRGADGKEKTIEYKVWNATVANLTLMALGSSAPEILLSVLESAGEIGADEVPSGGLGPGTIVGSAAFNLLVIIAICVMAIPDGGSRTIKEPVVFSITAFFSIFAYILLFLFSSDNQIELWEAIVTFLLFPVLVILCFMADKKMACFASKVVPGPDDEESGAVVTGTSGMGAAGYGGGTLQQKIAKMDFAKKAMEGLQAERGDGSTSYDDMQKNKEKVAQLMVAELQKDQPVSRAQYRANATRMMAGKQRVLVTKEVDRSSLEALEKKAEAKDAEKVIEQASGAAGTAVVEFGSPAYAVEENKGKVLLSVVRSVNTDSNVTVDFSTSDGSAMSGEDYVHTRGIVEFKKGEVEKQIEILLIDDTEYEPDENFFVTLRLPKEGKKGKKADDVELGGICVAQVTILNDDKPGTFSFDKGAYSVKESNKHVEITVKRTEGSDGDIAIKYRTTDGSAVAGSDYEPAMGELLFKNMETEKKIKIALIEDDAYEKSETFNVVLELPGSPDNGVIPGEFMEAMITIVGDEEYQKIIDQVAELMQEEFDKLSLESDSWGAQFDEAMNLRGEEGETPGLSDHIMHILTFGWKVLFATVPPTSWYGGWLAFGVALVYIGILTAFIADTASIFGCLLGLPATVTAITFVALGTSLPDTFASQTAAINEKYADAAIGNVTGSNSVNVFLGLGLPWLIVTLAHSAMGHSQKLVDGTQLKEGAYGLEAGDLGFSVVLFCILACICIAGIYVRRYAFKAELGGPMKTGFGLFFLSLWFVYIIVSIMKTAGLIGDTKELPDPCA